MKRILFSGEWNDLLGSVEDAVGTAALSREQYGDGAGNSGYLMRFWRHDQDDEMQLAFQLTHDVLVPGEARFHIHTIPMAVPSAGANTVLWTYHWVIAPVGANVPRTGWTSSAVSQVIATTYTHEIKHICSVPLPAGLPASSMLFFRLIRTSSSAADNYAVGKATSGGGLTQAANLAMIGLDIHIQRSRVGTRGEFA